MELLDRMGITDDLRVFETAMGGQTIIDAAGRPLVEMPSSFFSGELEISRGDLAAVLYDRTVNDVEYIFNTSVIAIEDMPGGADVAFRHGADRRFDLVIGADGMHSAVRALTFGPRCEHVTFRGYYAAGFETANTIGIQRAGVIFNEPGRAIMVDSGRDPATMHVGFVFKADRLEYNRHDMREIRQIITERFAGGGWRTADLLGQLQDASDLYFDPLEQIHVDRWSAGRVALVGDAAWCAGPGGSGTGLAMMGSYILAAELDAARGDHALAFSRYQRAMSKAAAKGQWQAKGAGRFLAPPTATKIRQRNATYRVLSTRVMERAFPNSSAARQTPSRSMATRASRTPSGGNQPADPNRSLAPSRVIGVTA